MCMIAETANLTAGLKDVKQAPVATFIQSASSEYRQNMANSAMSNREQNIGHGGLRECRHGQARSNGFELVAPDGAVGGLA